MATRVSVMCVGMDPMLLESRRLLLETSGFEASCHFAVDALKLLPASRPGLLIISNSVSEEDRKALAAITPEHTRVIQLRSFIYPQELLGLISGSSSSN